jgi:hypothetical protein
MASIKSTLSAIPGITTPIIIVLYKSTAPTAELARIVKSAPHPSPYNFTFNNLADGVYIINIHDSPDGVSLGNLRHDYWIDASTNNIISERIFFIVDGAGANDPVSGATDYINTTLDGKTISGVFQEGYRYLRPSVEWQPRAGGGITLLGGQKFDGGAVWALEITYTVPSPVVINNDAFSEIIDITTDTQLGSSQYNKSIYATPATSGLEAVLPYLSTVPDGKGYALHHNGGAAPNVTLVCSLGESIRFRGQSKTYVRLGIGEMIKVIKKGSSWYCTDYQGQFDRVGQKIFADIVGVNQLLCDGETTYDGNVYSRLWDYITNDVPVNQRVSFTEFDQSSVVNGRPVFQNRGFFAVDLNNETFKLPDLRNQTFRFVRNVGQGDPDRVPNLPGAFQAWSVGSHDHPLPADQSGTDNIQSVVNSSNADEGMSSGARTGSNSSGAENRVDNIGMLPVILI